VSPSPPGRDQGSDKGWGKMEGSSMRITEVAC